MGKTKPVTKRVADLLAERAIDHAINLEHYKTGQVNKMVKLLNDVDRDLVTQIAKGVPESFTEIRKKRLIEDVKTISREGTKVINAELRGTIRALGGVEAEYNAANLEDSIPVRWNIVQPSPGQVYAATIARPFQGKLLRTQLSGISRSRRELVEGAIQTGFVEGEGIGQIVRRIRGTKKLGYSDGLLEKSRRDIASIVRTAVNHTANTARDQVYQNNESLLKGVEWLSTLDLRTTLICAGYDGQVFPLDSGPRPPAHWNCRSTTIPVVKSWRELGIDLDEAPPGTRASMDGQVSDTVNYAEWLTKQTKARQLEILGPSRYKIWKAGEPITKFTTSGQVLTLDQLKAKGIVVPEPPPRPAPPKKKVVGKKPSPPPASKPKEEGKSIIAKKMENFDLDKYDDYSIVSVRVSAPGFDEYNLKIGDYIPDSHVWEDGTPTSEILDGASGIDARRPDLVKLVEAYEGDKIFIMGGRDGYSGNDIGEIVLRDSEIIDIL